ncbi:hypothetical protein SpCBS45565_g05827 [Spizellomyces sp. 'palustris']|nr:hypothetical protein SpCBS45565_g05827 [Spizellomyces sp. 'palustris']
MSFRNHTGLLVASGHRVVVGLDFGVTHSGFAYAHVADANKTEGYYEWDDQIMPYCKTLTALLYDKAAKKTINWGYTALKEATTGDHPNQKVLLTENKVSTGANGRRILPEDMEPLDIIAEYLKEMHTLIMTKLQEKFGSTLQNEDVHYAVTVPAIWSEQAKTNLRKAAAMAGLISSAEVVSPRLALVLEPEAAAMYCCKKVPEAQLRSNETMMIVDAGGGTVDIAVEKLIIGAERTKLTEVTRGTGDLCGSTFVDRRFLDWLSSKVGTDALTEVKSDNPTAYQQVLRGWETLKRQFKGAESFSSKAHMTFPIPGALYNLMADDEMEKLEEETRRNS